MKSTDSTQGRKDAEAQGIVLVDLPPGIFAFRRTGEVLPVRDIPDGVCFKHGNVVWEKVPDSRVNLSDLNDGSELLESESGMVLRQISQAELQRSGF